MTLVDVPLVTPATIELVIAAWSRTGAPIVRPSFGERRGHPVIFDRAVFDELRRAPLDVGARAVLSAHYHEIVNVPVDDPGCLVDVDTPEDYARAIGIGDRRKEIGERLKRPSGRGRCLTRCRSRRDAVIVMTGRHWRAQCGFALRHHWSSSVSSRSPHSPLSRNLHRRPGSLSGTVRDADGNGASRRQSVSDRGAAR